MKEKRLDTGFDTDYRLIGIASALREYRLCFFLNKIMECDFLKLNDHIIESKDRTRAHTFSVFKAEDSNFKNTFFVFSNKGVGDYMLPEFSNFDYLLMIKGELENEQMSNYIDAISNMESVLLCTEIPVARIKNKNRLVYLEQTKSNRLIKQKRL